MFEKEDLNKWFDPEYYKDYSKHNFDYNPNIKSPNHPMCRCSIIIKPEDVYFTYCTLWFVWKYKEECKESLVWVN